MFTTSEKKGISYTFEVKISSHDLEACLELYQQSKLLAVKALSKNYPGLNYSVAKQILEHASKEY